MKKIFLLLWAVAIFAACTDKESYNAAGTFEATEVVVSGQEQGEVLWITAEEGKKLNCGDTVAIIDTILLHHTKEQLKNSLQAVLSNRPDIATQISSLRDQISKQKLEQKRLDNLKKDGAATQKQIDDINSSIAVLESQLSAQKATLTNSDNNLSAQAKGIIAQISQITDRINRCTITSPTGGTVLAKYIEKGELALPGRSIFKVADIDKLFLRAYITSAQLADIKLGERVKVVADFGGDKRREYKGVISWISDKSEFTPKSIQTKDDRENLVYAVKIAVKNDGFIKIGMYGEVKFTEKRDK